MIQFVEDQIDNNYLKNKDFVFKPKWHNWNDFVIKTMEFFILPIQVQKITLTLNQTPLSKVELLPSEPKIEALFDEKWMSILIKNLISNSLKNSPKNSIVDLSYKAGSKGLEVVVSDNGGGVPKKIQPLLFQPLYKLTFSSTQASKSSGMGLSIAQTIAKNHNSEIRFEPNTPKGSKFSFKLKNTRKLKQSA